MKKDIKVFEIAIGDQVYTVDIRNKNKNSSILECMTFLNNKDDRIPTKRFQMLYDGDEKRYIAWTGNCTRDEDRIFRESVADLVSQIEKS